MPTDLLLFLALVTAGMPAGAEARDRLDPLRENLRAHVVELARNIGERNAWNCGRLLSAASYVERTLSGFGLKVVRHPYRIGGQDYFNLAAEVRGESRPDRVIVVGAHYDTAPGTPGADDNASGVAGMLELARMFAARKPSLTIRFVAFVNEEPPYFRTGNMGSLVYAKECRARKENIVAMLSLEMIGYFKDARKSQGYPFPFSFFYPDTGNFIAVVGNSRSRPLVNEVRDAIERTGLIPVESLATFEFVPGVDFSDHRSFWKCRYPAAMITDTAFYRNRDYHGPGDTPDKLDYNRMARVVRSLERWLSVSSFNK